MKKPKKLFTGLMLSLFLVLAFSATTYAKTKADIVNTKQNKWFSMKSVKYGYRDKKGYLYDAYETLYKITIPRNSFVKIELSSSGKDHRDIYLLDKSKQYVTTIWKENGYQSPEYCVLPEGTYYLGTGYNGVKCKYLTFKYTNPGNYCAAKAISLKSGKTIYTVQTPKYNYDRWYKIKLTKKQVITFWSNSEYSATLYDAKLKPVNIVQDSAKKYYTYAKQKKGTYYVRISSLAYEGIEMGGVITFKWK